MTTDTEAKKKYETKKKRVYIFGGIAFVLLSSLVVALDSSNKSSQKDGVDVSVFSSKKQKHTAPATAAQPVDILSEDDPTKNQIVGVEKTGNEPSSLIEESIGMSEVVLMEKIVRDGTLKNGEPYKVMDMLSSPEEKESNSGKSTQKEKPVNKCLGIDSAYSLTLISDPSLIRNNDVRTKWMAMNSTENHVAIIVSQDKNDVGVVFLPPNSDFSSSVAATHLNFTVKSGDNKCVDWGKKGGIRSQLPLMKKKGENGTKEDVEFYEKNTFQTVVKLANGRVTAKTDAVKK